MKRPCDKCGEYYEKKSKYSKICDKCWFKSHINGGTNSAAAQRIKCYRCKKKIMPSDQRVRIFYSIRNTKVKYLVQPHAWKSKTIANFHKRCFKIRRLK